MSNMTDFINSFGFIIFFLIMSLGLSMTAGEKVLRGFLVLVLLGMIFTNWKKIDTVIRRYSTNG